MLKQEGKWRVARDHRHSFSKRDFRVATAHFEQPTPNAEAKNPDRKKFQWSIRKNTNIDPGRTSAITRIRVIHVLAVVEVLVMAMWRCRALQRSAVARGPS